MTKRPAPTSAASPAAMLERARQLHRAGRLGEAVAAYREILRRAPDDPNAPYHLADALLRAGDIDEAIEAYAVACANNPDNIAMRQEMGRALIAAGRQGEAIAQLRAAVDMAPDDPGPRLALTRALTRIVPRWHTPMMNDTARNAAYEAALKRVVTPASHVLEIGAGSGLLAMLAARAGARRVTTCEAVPLIAETASAIIADNGFSDTVKVIAKRSTELTVGGDLDEPADVLVCEVLSSEFLAENVLDSLADARARLLKPGAPAIPAAGAIMVALAGGEDFASNFHVGEVSGFDLSRFNRITGDKFPLYRPDLAVKFVTRPTAAFTFDFTAAEQFAPDRRQLRLPITAAGRAHAIVQWNRLQMDAVTTFENSPVSAGPASAWRHMVYRLDEPVAVEPGQSAVIAASHDTRAPWFRLEGIAGE